MRIGIIGGGAIGLLLSRYLGRHHEIRLFVNRKQQADAIRKNNIKMIPSLTEQAIIEVAAADMAHFKAADCYFVCVKQPHLNEILPYLHEIPQQTPIIFLQNGMAHLQKLKTLPQPAYVGIVEHGAKRTRDDQVHHLGKGIITLANVSGTKEQLEQLKHRLNREDFPFSIVQNWEAAMKGKLIINCVINPLTALFHVMNKEIIQNPHLNRLASQLCKEAVSVLDVDYDIAWKKVKETALNTGGNTSSMLTDIQNGNETEIKAISGYLLKKSKVELPYTTFVYEAILALERKGK